MKEHSSATKSIELVRVNNIMEIGKTWKLFNISTCDEVCIVGLIFADSAREMSFIFYCHKIGSSGRCRPFF